MLSRDIHNFRDRIKIDVKEFNETLLGYYRDKINASEVEGIATEGKERGYGNSNNPETSLTDSVRGQFIFSLRTVSVGGDIYFSI